MTPSMPNFGKTHNLVLENKFGLVIWHSMVFDIFTGNNLPLNFLQRQWVRDPNFSIQIISSYVWEHMWKTLSTIFCHAPYYRTRETWSTFLVTIWILCIWKLEFTVNENIRTIILEFNSQSSALREEKSFSNIQII